MHSVSAPRLQPLMMASDSGTEVQHRQQEMDCKINAMAKRRSGAAIAATFAGFQWRCGTESTTGSGLQDHTRSKSAPAPRLRPFLLASGGTISSQFRANHCAGFEMRHFSPACRHHSRDAQRIDALCLPADSSSRGCGWAVPILYTVGAVRLSLLCNARAMFDDAESRARCRSHNGSQHGIPAAKACMG